MNAKGLTVLVGATLVVAALAAFALNRSSRADSGDAERGSAFYEGLMERVNDVARIEITRGDESFAVARDGNTWGLPEKGGYPAKFETVKETIVGIAGLETIESKTSKAEHHDELGLGDPADPDGRAKLVTLEDASGEELASLVVGDVKHGRTPSVYVRRQGEDQTWYCEGRLNVTTQPLSWVDRKIAQIERDRIAGAEIVHPDGETVTVGRPSKDDTAWTLSELPAGRDVSSASALSPIATWLTYLSLDDVRAADDVDFTAEPGPVLETRTFDGLVVRVETASADGRTWARLAARHEPPPPAEEAEEAGEAEPAEDLGDGAEDQGAAADGATGLEDADATPEVDVRAEAEELSARHERWAYALPDYKATQLEKRVDDLLAPLPETEPEEEPTAAGGAEDPPPVDAPPAKEPPAEEPSAEEPSAETSPSAGEPAPAEAPEAPAPETTSETTPPRSS